MRTSGVIVATLGLAVLGSLQAADREESLVAEKSGRRRVLPAADKDGWRSLFDGKTLNNWQATRFGGEGKVSVEAGAIGLDMGTPLTGVTWNGAKLPTVNYEVKFEGRRVKGDDFFCALTFPYQDTHASLVLGGWGGTIVGISNINGYDAAENESTEFYQFKKNEWYNVRLKVTDSTITTWINDEEIFTVDVKDKTVSTRIEVHDSKPFGFCSFETQGEIRNIKLREIAGTSVEP